MTTPVPAPADLALAALFVIVDGGLSLWMRLGVARPLFVSALRMVVQLSLMALVLEALFRLANPWLTLAAALVMVSFAGREIAGRQEYALTGHWAFTLPGGSMATAAIVVTVLALATQLRPEPWWRPDVALPILGMILGNAMNGVSLALNSFGVAVSREKAAIEAMLCLGHDRREALRPFARRAMTQGLMPTINGMSAIGVVSLPGMMTGQILAGASPATAVSYQIFIMFLIAGATGLGVVIAVRAGMDRLTDERHRLRLDRLRRRA